MHAVQVFMFMCCAVGVEQMRLHESRTTRGCQMLCIRGVGLLGRWSAGLAVQICACGKAMGYSYTRTEHWERKFVSRLRVVAI